MDLDKLNEELMPTANDIKSKMDMLQKKYNFNLDFSFKEISMDEIINDSSENS